jgi:hypothetical protein
MNELTVIDKSAEWRRMKSLVLDSVSSPITKRVYNMALDEFFAWYGQESRPGFTKATVSAWRVTLEERKLGSSSIIVRMSAIRKLATEAADNGLLAPELAAGGSTCSACRKSVHNMLLKRTTVVRDVVAWYYLITEWPANIDLPAPKRRYQY